jgi:hypothetical protein
LSLPFSSQSRKWGERQVAEDEDAVQTTKGEEENAYEFCRKKTFSEAGPHTISIKGKTFDELLVFFKIDFNGQSFKQLAAAAAAAEGSVEEEETGEGEEKKPKRTKLADMAFDMTGEGS